ncbi:hypothetical protein TIFTF001_054766 [Ficus carica]|uniref:Uncharacterized protein n=1 Tax=Ficus carica TaxID=3494 RepID=A0AA88EER9_FICCA|nr:hypothetical protein TIFTF001_054766 [Ficus carica]
MRVPLTFLAFGLPQQRPRSTSAFHSPNQACLHLCVNALRLCRIQCFASHRASVHLCAPVNSSAPRVQAPVLATCPVGSARAAAHQLH